MIPLHVRLRALADHPRGPSLEDNRQLVFAAARIALEVAAQECEHRWRAGYKGEVSVGFAHVIRDMAEELK